MIEAEVVCSGPFLHVFNFSDPCRCMSSSDNQPEVIIMNSLNFNVSNMENVSEEITINKLNDTIKKMQCQLDNDSKRATQLEKELSTERLKNDGLKTLVECLQESKTENRNLKALLKRSRNSLRKLKQQFSTGGASVVTGPDDISDISDESFLTDHPLSARAVLDNQPANDDHVRLGDLQRRVRQLEAEREHLMSSSENSKDAEILKLRKDLETSRKSCESLTEENVKLKSHLTRTVSMCRRSVMSSQESKDEASNTTASGSLSLGLLEKSRDSDLKQQYEKIERQLKEVVSMNSRWQQYNGQREKYVQQLLQRVAELEQAMVNKGQMLSIAQQEAIDKLLSQQKQKVEMAEDARKLLEVENKKLVAKQEDLLKSFNQKDSIISILQDRLAVADRHQADAKAHLERYDVLQMQLQMYKDDFVSERRDRERAWERIDQLEKQLRLATQQLNFYQSTHRQHFPTDNPRLDGSLIGRGVDSSIQSDQAAMENNPTNEDLDLQPTE